MVVLTQDLLLLATRPCQLSLLFAGHTVTTALIDIGLAHPSTDRLHGGLELLGKLLW